MDELKLNRWKENFEAAANLLKIEFDSYFKHKMLSEYYELKVEEVGLNLSLIITDQALPGSIKHRLEKLLIDTKPEDSI